MNNQNKHKPLDPDELFKLLEERSNSSDASFSNSDMNDLDEFEKEALEGFAMHTTPAKAKALIEEINLEISNKTQAKESSSRKHKIIWFSAAASLVFVISLSVFLINQTQKEQESNIALNEIKSADEMAPAKEFENKPQEAPAVTETTKEEGKEKLKQETVDITVNAQRTEPDTKLAEEKALEFSNTIIQSAKGVSSENNTVATGTSQNQLDYRKTDANNDMDGVTLSDKTTVTDDKEAKKKETDQLTTTNGVAANYNYNNEAITTKSLSKNAKDETVKERAALKKNKAVEKSANVARTETTPAEMEYSSATVPASVNVPNTQGYYVGGEVSIKDQVLTYFKNKSITQTLKGTFKVMATIDEKGKLSVDTLNSVNNVCTDCIKPLKEALNSMNNWQPASQQGKPVLSKTSFTLIF